MSEHATCDVCATLRKLTHTGLVVRHYLSIDVSRRAVPSVGHGRVKRLCAGSGRPPRTVAR